ncbi:MAG: magnesium-translocating P-type ATPase [Chloroflexi bacterium]|nr:magnesium-translocating P-type ATPase [Chloroflexota bacterium]
MATLPPGNGLTAEEAAERLARYGPNTVETSPRFRLVRTFVGLLTNPLVLILLAASIMSGALGEALNASLIVLIVVLSIALDFYQVFRSEQAASRLQQLITPTAQVWRADQLLEVPVRDVVPGDLLEVCAGDLIAADGSLEQALSLTLDEAALTGESLPVEKGPGAPGGSSVYAGTSVVSGLGRVRVTATGSNTQFGAIARALIERAPPSEFELGTRRFGFLIMRTVVGLVMFVFLVNALLQRPPLESLLFALALAVGLTPEFLPMIITVTLSQGALRMAHGKVIVKRLAAIENLGSMDVLCSDKTGTLTRGVVTLQEHLDIVGSSSEAVLRLACVNSALETGLRSPLDTAILAHEHPAITNYSKLDELPFDFERRRVSVLASGPDGVEQITKGAPESLLAACTSVLCAGQVEPLSAETRQAATATLERLSRAGYHVLGIGLKPHPPGTTRLAPSDEAAMVFVGFAAFFDPPDESARRTIADLRQKGVAVKILTGDGELITRTVCDTVGIPVERIVLGDELITTSDDALAAIVARTDVFARVSPSQKNRVIRALKRNGHVVGYIGDGINDAPSLHAADVGISVSNGVDVAKAAADIILLEKSLAAVHRGVVEGRRSFGNIAKYVLMGTSSNFGNVLSMALASAFLPFLPLLAVQILLNNFLYDLSQLTIPTDNVDESYVAMPRRWDTGLVKRFMFRLGPVSSIYDFLTFALLLGVFHAGPSEFRAGWFIESLATQTLVIFIIRTAGNPFRSRPSNALILSVCGSLAAGFLVVVTPIGQSLGFASLPPSFYGALLVLAATYLLLVEWLKRGIFRVSGWTA